MKKLPWPTSSYVPLEPNDLDPTPAPTPEQRIRVAAMLATYMRDSFMTNTTSMINSEVIRAILTMNPEAWERDIVGARKSLFDAEVKLAYDPEDPKVRFEQVHAGLKW